MKINTKKKVFNFIAEFNTKTNMLELIDKATSKETKDYNVSGIYTQEPTIADEIEMYEDLIKWARERIEILKDLSPNTQKDYIFKS